MKEQPIDLIYQLEEADAATLRRLWARSKVAEPPKTFTARLMHLALALDAQATGVGCKAKQARRDWNRIIKRRGGGAINSSAKTPPNPMASDGSRILKNWGDATHEVVLTESSATWNDQS